MKRRIWSLTALLFVLLAAAAPPASAIIKSWRSVLSGSVNAVAVTSNPVSGQPSILFAGTPTDIKKSIDNGVTWTSVSANQTNCLAVDPKNPAVVYSAGTAGLFKSTDYGQTWSAVNALVPIRYWVTVSPFDSKILFGDNKRSIDGGATWTVMTGFPTAFNTSLHIRASRDPAYPGFLLAAANELSFRSDDNGVTWKTLKDNYGRYYEVDSVEIDPTDARYYYLGGRCGREITRFYWNGTAIASASVGPDHVHGMTVDPSNHARVFAYTDGGSTYASSNFFVAAQSGSSASGARLQGRMVFDASNGQVLLPTSYGLLVKNSWCTDAESDGYSPQGGLCGSVDCDDASSARNPGAVESCLDGIDNNCNDLVDMADARCIALCSDKDLDLHLAVGCPSGDDCNDSISTVFAGAPEVCDYYDNNCNGTYNEGFDADGDGWSSCFDSDCNDSDPLIHPYAPEVCDGIDNDCDPTTIEKCPRPIFAWGDNAFGQVGDGTSTDRKSPVAVSGLLPWLGGAGYSHSLAVLDGKVWAWGNNALGQLGDGTATQRKAPVQVLSAEAWELYPDDVMAVAGGSGHSLALGSNGWIWAWGDNAKGQLGDYTKASSSRPVQVAFIGYASAIAAGANHSLALYDGWVAAWGDNTKSQLGDGSSVNRNSPVYVEGLWDYSVTAIAAGAYHSLALKTDGTVWAWGDNSKGQLGDGTLTPRKTPVQVTGLTDVVAISVGWYHTLALKSDGTVWAWGENKYGQLGDGTTTLRRTPTQVKGLAGVKVIAAGNYHNLAADAAGVKAWGYNKDGQLGDGTTTTRTTPVAVLNSAGATSVFAGAAHSLLVK